MKRRTGWLLSLFVLAASPLLAGGSGKKQSQPTPPPKPDVVEAIQTAETVHVRVGSGNVLTFPSRVVRVAVGDDKVVALHLVEARQILLQGLLPGRSTVFAWLADGRRLRYDLVVSPRVEVLESALHNLDPRIIVDAGADSGTLILSGKVADERVANEARQLAENMLGTSAGGTSRVVSLLQFPGSNDADLRLTSALAAVDPRIRLRRIQVGAKVSNTADAVVLEGRVKDIPALVRAITLAELQLGGVGGKIEPLAGDTTPGTRNRNFSGSGGLQRLQGSDAPPSGLAAYVARGLILKSASGRVLSFLEVDELPQIMVSIRVLQVDRGRARRLGIDYRLDGSGFSAGSFHQPGRTTMPAPPPPSAVQSITGLTGGNIVATFIDKTLAVAAAIDFLQQKDLARSVAEPNITTLSGESASVLVGGEVPIPTTTVGTTAAVQGFLFQDFGVRLDIRPTLAPSGLVAMEISPSIIRPSSDLAVSGVPGFQVQSVQTTAKVAPGQTLVIGGLISFEDEIQKRGVPGLSEVPLMKHLFSWEGRTLQEQEILFVITPRILAEGPDQVAEAIQWRDVEPLAPGSIVELPPADLEHVTSPKSATVGKDGLPPSFSTSGGRRKEKAPSRSDAEIPTTHATTPSVVAPAPQTQTAEPAALVEPAPVKSEVNAFSSTEAPPPPPPAPVPTTPKPTMPATKPSVIATVPSTQKQAAKKSDPAALVEPAPTKSEITFNTVSSTQAPSPSAPVPTTTKPMTPATKPSVIAPASSPKQIAQTGDPLAPGASTPRKAEIRSTSSTAVPPPSAPIPVALKPPTPQPQQLAKQTASIHKGPPIAKVDVNAEVRASLTRDYQIEVVVSPHDGDAWSRLSKRITGSAGNWHELARLNGADEALTSEAHIRVPFAMIKPELQQEIIAKLIPKGSATESDWKRMSGHP